MAVGASPSSSLVKPLSRLGKKLEVEASFYQAMVGLLERQANVIPEQLFTKSDVQSIVQKELEKQRANSAVELPCRAYTSSLISISGILAAIFGSAGFTLFRRTCIAHPELMGWYVNSAVKGGVCGLIGALLFRRFIL